MPCYHPLTLTVNGERGRERQVPCGQCIGCRLERSRQWAVRLMHEAQFHTQSSFVTLTYRDSALPDSGSLEPEHLRLFIKRVRYWAKPVRVRFFSCGEYGDALERPHYHAILFGVWFPPGGGLGGVDSGGGKGFRSDELSRLWPHGFSYAGRVTFESAAYVARYVVKKVTGDGAVEYYGGRFPEFVRMSRRPGIGRDFFLSIVRICIRAMSVLFEGR